MWARVLVPAQLSCRSFRLGCGLQPTLLRCEGRLQSGAELLLGLLVLLLVAGLVLRVLAAAVDGFPQFMTAMKMRPMWMLMLMRMGMGMGTCEMSTATRAAQGRAADSLVADP